MSGAETDDLIDLVARELREHLADEASDALATQVVGQLQSRFLLIPRPPEEATGQATRTEINSTTKGPTQ